MLAIAFACNLAALAPAERTRHHALLTQLRSAVAAPEETADGYRLRLDEKKMPLKEAGEWISLERRCCPFLRFQLTVADAADLTLSGEPGAKELIALEML